MEDVANVLNEINSIDRNYRKSVRNDKATTHGKLAKHMMHGWDYPPNMGAFGVLSPRTCGSCPITGTLWLKVNNHGGMVTERMLTPEELKTLLRIKSEPESLLEEVF